MREIVSLHIGQGGIQLGNSCWQLFCLQHNIQTNGNIQENIPINKINDASTFFYSTNKGKQVPRAIFVDLEPTVIDQIKKGEYKQLFNKNLLISEKQSSAGLFSRANSIGKRIQQQIVQKIRKVTQNCDSLQGFLITHSIGGGTGSGLTSTLIEGMSLDYPKIIKFCFSIFPSPKIATSCVQPYNSILANNCLMQNAEVDIVLDNQALYQICCKKLDIQKPYYININRIIAQVVSSITTSIRFNGSLNTDFKDFQTNLIPYPRFRFMLSSYAPIIAGQNYYNTYPSVSDLTTSVFDPYNMMAKCDPRHGKYMACSLMYRGDIVPFDVNIAIINLKKQKTVQFMNWVPTGFKIGINHSTPVKVTGGDFGKIMRSVSMISNNSAIAQIFARLDHKFDIMYAKNAFIHWYTAQGLEQGQFSQARQNLASLQKDYQLGIEEVAEGYEDNQQYIQ